MKCQLVILALAILQVYVFAYPPMGIRGENMKQLKEDMKKCMLDHNIPEDAFGKNHTIPEDKKCFFRCMFEKSGLMTQNGQIDIEGLKKSDENIPEEILEAHRKCVETSNQPDPCDKAYAIAKCVRQNFDENREKHFQNVKQCREEFSISEDAYKRHEKIPEDKKCFFKCVAVKSGKMNENGDFTIDQFEKNHKMAPKFMVNSLKECVQMNTKTEACDKAQELCKCMREKQHNFQKKLPF